MEYYTAIKRSKQYVNIGDSYMRTLKEAGQNHIC